MGGVSPPFHLVQGASGPRQQSPTTCGAACATVARMLVDAPFARWIMVGDGHPVPGAEGGDQTERFAAWERTVQARTNGWRAPAGGLLLPWPKALGTPPWGLRHELEHGASRAGTRYTMVPVRGHNEEGLRARYRRLVDLVVDGEPAALYVGNRLTPRHVTLVLPGDRNRYVEVYDPASGRVSVLDEEAFVAKRLSLGGWKVPWVLVQPTGHRRLPVREPVTVAWRIPALGPAAPTEATG
ncbi:hypothetical protein N5P18_12610 [Janibacter terrae]|uniref:Peptidase C39-like domain-containing protein n=1 Tax=Janibacter terrae TaxID=103817 RepID=A0ABZ2FBP1_9MICO